MDESRTNLIEETRTWFVSDELLEYINLSMTITLHGVLSITGVVTNVVNMIIFIKLKFKTSMSVGLLALSFTDFLATTFQLASCNCFLVNIIYPESPVDPLMLGGYVFSWAHYLAYLISCWITTTLSVERCFCVVAPFTVRRIFTKARCIYTIIIIYLVHIATHLPAFYFAELKWVPVIHTTNSTVSEISVLKIEFTDDSAKWEILADIIVGVGLSLVSQACLLVCTVWMILSLKSTSQIRSSFGRGKNTTNIKVHMIVKTGNEKLSPRERRMAKTVLCLAVIVSVCNIPRFITTAFRHLVPGANLGAYQNLQILLWEISYIFGTSCCSFNMFVYLKLNSSFEKVFKTLCI